MKARSRRRLPRATRRCRSARSGCRASRCPRRVAQVAELPVDHRGQTLPVDDEIAQPEVAVYESRGRGGGGFGRSQRSPASVAGSGSPISSSWRSHSHASIAGSSGAPGSPSRRPGSIAWTRASASASWVQSRLRAGWLLRRTAAQPRCPRRTPSGIPADPKRPPSGSTRTARDRDAGLGRALTQLELPRIGTSDRARGVPPQRPAPTRPRPANDVSREAPPGIGLSASSPGSSPSSASTARTPEARRQAVAASVRSSPWRFKWRRGCRPGPCTSTRRRDRGRSPRAAPRDRPGWPIQRIGPSSFMKAQWVQ